MVKNESSTLSFFRAEAPFGSKDTAEERRKMWTGPRWVTSVFDNGRLALIQRITHWRDSNMIGVRLA